MRKIMEKWKFVYAGDIQPGSPRSYRYHPALMENWQQAKKQILGIKPEFLLVGGDITRDGSIHDFEFEEMKKEFDSLPFPVHPVAGNMDTGNKHTKVQGRHRKSETQCDDIDLNVTSEQLSGFSKFFGPLWWSFVHRGIRFSGVTDMIINSGLPEEKKFWEWAGKLASLPVCSNHVWITHYPPFVESPDELNWDINDSENYTNWYFTIDNPGRKRLLDLFRDTGTTLVISGHVHCHKILNSEGIKFEIAPAVAFGQWEDRWPDGDSSVGFLLGEVEGGKVETKFVPIEHPCEIDPAAGYGPGGHPLPELRDYSKARKK